MPTARDHRRQAQLNRNHAVYLLRTNPGDPASMQWAVTAAFYCAVHCIEAQFAAHGIHSRDHRERQELTMQPRFGISRDVRVAYRQLKQWSLQARYEVRQFSPAMVQQSVLEQHLPEVTQLINL